MRARRIFAWTVFPLVMAAVLAGTVATMRAGTAPPLAIVPWIAGAYLTIALLERVFPYELAWSRARGDVGTDTAWFVTNGALNRLLEPPVLAAAVAGGAWLAARVGLGLWPGHWTLMAQLALALVVAELFEYWFHRLMHERELLWRFHATHHSAPRLYWLNAVRFHPVDYIAVGIVKLVPLAALGAPAEVFALVNVFAAVHGAFQHANLEIRLGPLNWVFSMAELHRWHHSRELAEANSNYGGNLILWDIVFGTRFLPAGRRPPAAIGLADLPAFPMTFWGQMISPLRWPALPGEAAPAASPYADLSPGEGLSPGPGSDQLL